MTRTSASVRRVWSHANQSARHLVALFPGTMDDEEQLKIDGFCPACGKALWYYSTPKDEYLRRR